MFREGLGGGPPAAGLSVADGGLDVYNRWFVAARRRYSRNRGPRPPGTRVDLLVIHGISLPTGAFGGPWIEALFTNTLDCSTYPDFLPLRGLRVSSHLLVRRDGTVVQFVPLDERAWHAGVSRFDGRENCNDFSIGIELEGCDTTPYTAIQYRVLAALTRVLMGHYPGITPERITGHADIAPGRKSDPGTAFDWSRYRELIAQTGAGA